jgi:radical SAM protein with 4Fe4S-binding SPASM domain
MCHVSFMPPGYKSTLNPDFLDNLDSIAGRHVIIGTGFEPLMHKNFVKIIEKLTELKCQLEITTNGSLLTGASADALANSDLRIVNFSFDGIEKKTYENIRRNGNYEEVLNNILKFKLRFQKRPPLFAVNSTMQRINMFEVPKIVDFWDAQDFDLVRLLFMVVRENSPELIQQSLFPVREQFYEILDDAASDVINKKRKIRLRSPYFRFSRLRERYPNNFTRDVVHSDNPDSVSIPTPRQELQQGFQDGKGFPCRSPWTFAKILPTGMVQLCYQFEVGDLSKQSFDAIWFGKKADSIRKQLTEDPAICARCDYFRFCISSDVLDVNDIKNYFSERLTAAADDVNFDTGIVSATIPPSPPKLAATIGAVNIVEFSGKFFVVPHSVGVVDLSTTDLSTHPSVSVTSTLAAARKIAREHKPDTP